MERPDGSSHSVSLSLPIISLSVSLLQRVRSMIDIITTMSSGTDVDPANPTLSSINEWRTKRDLQPITERQAFIAYIVASYTVDLRDASSLIPSEGSPIPNVFGGLDAFREAGRAVIAVGGMEEVDFVAGLENSFIQRINVGARRPPSLTDLTEDGFATGLYVLFVTLLKRAEQC